MADSVSRNPKNVAARSKIGLALFPPAGLIHGAAACMHGANVYGAYNWRQENIAALEYCSAAMRHIVDWIDGEEVAPDSQVHHLGHAIAGLAILLDALESKTAIDDRPTHGPAAEVLERLRVQFEARIKDAEQCDAIPVKAPAENQSSE